jgi:beta-glucosidase
MYMPSSPLGSLRGLLPGVTLSYDDGTDPARAAAAARTADLVVVFAEQFAAEGKDLKSLSLPDNQDSLIDAVATANPHTVVVLETCGPVTMPWLIKVPAVLEAWYPGQRGGMALARILTGDVNPSGRLSITFPTGMEQLPNPSLAGRTIASDTTGKDIYDVEFDKHFTVTYPEGADVGYRWYDRKKTTPLFAFGHGLTYTTFTYSKLAIKSGSGLRVTFQVTNSGDRVGSEVAQVYALVCGVRRLVGWSRVELNSRESKTVTVAAEPRLLASFDTKGRHWTIAPGMYSVEVGAAVNEPRLMGKARLTGATIKP